MNGSEGTTVDVDRPLTDRLLMRMPGSRMVWMALWALVPLIRPFVLQFGQTVSQTASGHSTGDLLLAQAVQAYAVFLALHGATRLSRGLAVLESDEVNSSPSGRIRRAIHAVGTKGPIVLGTLVIIGELAIEVASHGPLVALLDAPLLVLNVLPLATFVWVFVALLVSLDDLGRSHLRLDPFPQDRSLGLGPVGSLAFTGLWLVLATAVPIVILSGRELGTFILGVTVILGSVAALLAATWGIHRQMTAAKARYQDLTRRVFRDAFAPFRDRPDLDVLAEQANVLRAAQALDERAERIYEWPIDERTVGRLAIVSTGVITGLVVRAVLVAVGY